MTTIIWHLTKRTARKKASRCCNARFGPNNKLGDVRFPTCKENINIGDSYYDTNERIEVWATLKLCVPCGEKMLQEKTADCK